MVWLFLFLGVVGVVVAACFSWYRYHSPYSAKECPNCLGVKTYRLTSSQTLASIGAGGAKGRHEQVIETFECSNCGYTAAKNRLQTTQQSGS